MDQVAMQMREIVLKRRELLHNLSDKDIVYVLYNGEYWKGRVVTIRKHNIAYPEFRVRSEDDNRLDWVSGAQIFLESEIPERFHY